MKKSFGSFVFHIQVYAIDTLEKDSFICVYSTAVGKCSSRGLYVPQVKMLVFELTNSQKYTLYIRIITQCQPLSLLIQMPDLNTHG